MQEGTVYSEFQYLYPPRPEFVLSYDRLPFYEKMGWIGQYKKNGTCSLIGVSPAGEIISMNRHKENHRAWDMPEWMKEELRRLFPKKEWTVLVGELLHNKTPSIKDTMYIFDILVLRGKFLYGSTFTQRSEILDSILPKVGEEYSHYVIDAGLWRAKTLKEGLLEHFKGIKEVKIDEGIVLKDPSGKLRLCDRVNSNSSWQAKVRHSAKNYQF